MYKISVLACTAFVNFLETSCYSWKPPGNGLNFTSLETVLHTKSFLGNCLVHWTFPNSVQLGNLVLFGCDSMLAPCWFTLWTSSRYLYPHILLISLEIFLFSSVTVTVDQNNLSKIIIKSTSRTAIYMFGINIEIIAYTVAG